MLRERLLAHLRGPAYVPANESELARRLGLNKKQRASLTQELRLLLSQGSAVRAAGGKIAPAPAPSAKPPRDRTEVAGKIQFRAGGSAFVIPDPTGRPAELPALQISSEDTGLALPGDRVAVRVLEGVRTRRPGETAGTVLRVLERGRETVVGNLSRSGRMFVVTADDPRFIHPVAVTDPAKAGLPVAPQVGDKVVVRLNEWKQRHLPLTGQITERLGRTHEPRAELLGIFQKYELDTEFPPEVEREAATLPDRVPAKDTAHRLDFRDSAVLTIDPDDAKDFDDALSYEVLGGGDVRIGVHIADVSAYVRPGTALDREAQRRGNSTYLVGTVIPMLPEKLSNGLCSLVEGQDRLCKAVLLTFAKNGRIKDTAFANTVIRSRKRLTYRQAYAFLFENDLERIRALPLPPKHQTGSTGRALRELSDTELVDIQSWIRSLWKIAARLRRDRMANGSLDLNMPETKIFVDEQGYADRLERIEQDESHQLIEEFMLAANEAVARITRRHQLPSLYRVHDEPDEERLEEFRQFVGTFGLKAGDLTRKDEVIKLLAALHDHPQGYTLRSQFLRSLKKACYRAAADGHYGLSKDDYTHFTSPIRRYSDLVVHRVLGAYLTKQGRGLPGEPAGYDIRGVERLAEHLSLTEQNSMEAERESVKIKLLEFFERELNRDKQTVFAAVITDTRRNGLFIELVESMTFGFVSADNLPSDHYLLNQAGTSLVGRKHRRHFDLGGKLSVVVDQVDRFKRLIDFRLAKEK
ncbi:MAG TPA: RNB domain-containing ribonuclease [Opitutaceae bacterium]|jgi:ribonuclease R|nr:RNB domain-containing ribonuclease [Opitutaceae bacterium]